MDEGTLFEVLGETSLAIRAALDDLEDWREHGERPGQYRLDLVADAAALPVLHDAGLAVLSEESGTTGPGGNDAALLAVLDPVDGSTNASLGLPWFATSICVMDADGPAVALVVNQVTGVEYRAVRGAGASRDGTMIAPSDRRRLSESVIGVSGLPRHWPGWAQFRALGAASLDLCAVAEGVLDGYLPVGGSDLHPWDYLAAVLICQEAGAALGERSSLDLEVRAATTRRPVAAANRDLLDQLLHLDV